MTAGRRVAAFAVAVGLAVAGVTLSLRHARTTPPAAADEAPAPATLIAPPDRPFVVVRQLGPGDSWGRVALVPLDAPDGPRHVTALRCDRVYVAGGRGVCLEATGLTGRAVLLDAGTWQPRASLALTGPPSRARVSRNGRYAAFTVFEQGHSYADDLFSTRTTIVDTGTGTPLPDLETWPAWQGASRLRRADLNYWGVTFEPDGRHVYATLAFAGTPYLVRGDLETREFRVVAPHVECPSLSPDGRRIAFKRAVGLKWRLWVRDLASGVEHVVAGETRSIDDQVEWLDDRRLLYQFPSDDGNHVYVVDADGTTPARVFVRDAWSPAVVR